MNNITQVSRRGFLNGVFSTGALILGAQVLPESLTAIRERLSLLGLEVDAEPGGDTALRRVEANMAEGRPYDLMLIDWRMAPLDGIATLDAIRQLLGPDGARPVEVKIKDKPFDELVGEHVEGMMQLLNQFRRPDTPYLSRPYVKFVNRYSAYDHLARVKEWSLTGGEAEEEAGGE